MSPGVAVNNPLEELDLGQLRSRTSLKWTAHPPDVLPLWIAEMDVRLAPPIVSVLEAAISAGDTGYSSGRGYARAVSSFAESRWDWPGLEPARTAVVPDVMAGIVEVLNLLTAPGDVVVVCPPVYAPFYAFVRNAGRRVLEAPLRSDGRLDLSDLSDTFARARMQSEQPVLLLSNPHNPTGTVHTRAELTAVAALATAYGVRVISDEIHAPLVLPGAEFVPYLSIPEASDGFALYSGSKGWNLAGLKAALLVAGPDADGDLDRLPPEVGLGPSHLGVLAHTAAFDHGGAWLDDLLAGLDANRTLLRDLVEVHLPGVELLWPEATYLAWLDCRALRYSETTGRSGTISDLDGPARVFLDDSRVALSSGHIYGSGGSGFVRLNYATSRALLTEAVVRMGTAVRGHPPKSADPLVDA